MGEIVDGHQIQVEIMTVNPVTGDPTGTLYNAAAIFDEIHGTQASPFLWSIVFDTPFAVTVGEVVAILIKSLSIHSSNVLLVTETQRAFPYTRSADFTPAYTAVEGQVPLAFAYVPVEGERTYVAPAGGLPINQSINIGPVIPGSFPDAEIGITFIPEFDMDISGIWFAGKIDADKTLIFKLYRAKAYDVPTDAVGEAMIEGDVVSRISIQDSFLVQPAGADVRPMSIMMFGGIPRIEPSIIRLSAGTRYYLLCTGLEFSDMQVVYDMAQSLDDPDQLSLPNSWKYSSLIVVPLVGAWEVRGALPDLGLVLRNARILTTIGGGVPPGTLGLHSVQKAEFLKEILGDDNVSL
jgi:hypothetical protein